MRGELRIGTSGWTYSDWKGRFYPEELKSADYLAWYARRFDTTEINYSFYHLPQAKTFEKWAAQTPETFVFAVKVSRYITHIERLGNVREPWEKFLDRAAHLGPKLGPLLLQFPPSFRADIERLEAFLETSRQLGARRLAFEFRHASWFVAETAALLGRHDAALVIAHSSRYPCAPPEATASFVYLRFHGPKELFASRYSEAELADWAKRIRAWRREGRSVYAYFNNDWYGYAIENAETLARLAGKRSSKTSASSTR
jgi:uncharacterized protein YecE (DUF72 family)